MSSSPREGIVDANCRVHDVNNLFVASSSVFPTSGQANPTLLAVAMAARLAEHIAARLAPARLPLFRTGAQSTESKGVEARPAAIVAASGIEGRSP
jgi:choline dehydrogenase-like flavoprotein